MDQRKSPRSIWILGVLVLSGSFATTSLSAQPPAQLERAALEVFKLHCAGCHSGSSPTAGLDLTSVPALLKGSQRGPVVVKGASENSILYQKVSDRTMPPPGLGQPLSSDQIEAIRKWIDTGASGPDQADTAADVLLTSGKITEEDRNFWAFRPLARPTVPKVKGSQRVRTAIDAFLLSKLESKGLTFSADAPKWVLMRRAYFDLVGLPPSPDEVRQFVSAGRTDAYERMIDRLLDSPHYGERWGRHWLDVAGYTDEASYASELDTLTPNEGIWRYRDYVIRSLNKDKPFDRFLTEQIAGDELFDWRNAASYTPEILDALVATGFLRTVKDLTDEPELKRPIDRYEVLFRVADHFTSSILGLTGGCARCHDHKYDPIPQADYYRLLAIFAHAYNPDEWLEPKDRYLPDVSQVEQDEIRRHNEEIDRPLGDMTGQLDALLDPHRSELFDLKLSAAVPDSLKAEVRLAFATPLDKRTAVQRYLFSQLSPAISVSASEIESRLSERERTTKQKLEERIETLRGWRRSTGKVQALWDTGSPPTIRFLHRGSLDTPGPEVTPGFLSVLSDPKEARSVSASNTASSGQRLGLARWLTEGGAASLTARVMVNRIWTHHFGSGIVRTPGNFGRQGALPTHPELLDWLASDFIENGWKIKRLHKLVMTSTAYKQSSRRPPRGEPFKAENLDPGNDLLWRMNPRRLEAEALRDAVLSVSGKLNLTSGGPPVPLEWGADALITASVHGPTDGSQFRRSVYLFARRNYSASFLDVFDFPVMALNCTERTQSATPLQSLTMLNSEFAMERANDCAARINKLAGPKASRESTIGTAFVLAFGRTPSAEESQASLEHLAEQEDRHLGLGYPAAEASQSALAGLCRALMASTEFLYVE